MPTLSRVFHINFRPENWSELEHFTKLHASSYNLDWHGGQALSGITGHLQRVQSLFELAQTLVPLLEEDRAELEQHGFSSAKRSRELAAVMEACIIGIYSAVDCTREVCTRIFKRRQGVSDSTRRFFQNAKKGILDQRIPSGIREAFADAEWQEKLVKIRDKITHFDVGSCHQDRVTKKISYMHPGLGSPTRAGIIEDIFEYIKGHWNEANIFINKISRELNQFAQNCERQVYCGFFEGRVYTRSVQTQSAKTFHDGMCLAHTWFEQESNPKCPLASQCGAYARAKSLATATNAMSAPLA